MILGDLKVSDLGCELEIDGVDHGELFGTQQMGNGRVAMHTEKGFWEAEERGIDGDSAAYILPLNTPCRITDRSYNIPAPELKALLTQNSGGTNE